MAAEKREQTLVLIKPDALRNSLTGYVLSILSEFHTNLVFAGTKIVHVSTMLAAEHYAEHRDKPFFPALIEYITGQAHYPKKPEKQRVIAIVYQGSNAVKSLRQIAGPTNPHEAREVRPGCIRSLGTIVPLKDALGSVIGQRMDNLIHASANLEDAEREIKLWFRPADIPPHMRIYQTEVCDEHFYCKDGKLSAEYVDGSFCIVAPGDNVWSSDLAALRAIVAGRQTDTTLESVVAKYLVNQC